MAFPSSNSDDLASAWSAIRNSAAVVKRDSQTLHDRSAAGNVEAALVLRYVDALANHNDSFARYTTVPGLAAYVREQISDPAVDIVAEYQTMLAQINATRTWIINNFPKDGTGYLLYHTLGADGRIVQRSLTPAQTAGLRTQLTALIATID